MPIKKFMQTPSMDADTYSEITGFSMDIPGERLSWNLIVWGTSDKEGLITNLKYEINASDPLWGTYFQRFLDTNDISDAIEDYLETKAEFEGVERV